MLGGDRGCYPPAPAVQAFAYLRPISTAVDTHREQLVVGKEVMFQRNRSIRGRDDMHLAGTIRTPIEIDS